VKGRWVRAVGHPSRLIPQHRLGTAGGIAKMSGLVGMTTRIGRSVRVVEGGVAVLGVDEGRGIFRQVAECDVANFT
jgi:hypothetical protein